jgi:XTP/dITP diphosphohydrolase
VILSHGCCFGDIARAERGAHGFGYDPILHVRGDPRTMAELDDATKNTISHRARAVARILPIVRSYLDTR